jgi:prophage tail gpP-like protein
VDEIVTVDDEVTGIQEDLYIGDVSYERDSSGTRTTLRLYRPKTLLFAEAAP